MSSPSHLEPCFQSRDAPKSMLDMDDERLRQDLLDRLVDQKLTGPTLQIGNADPSKLVTKELPYWNMANLFVDVFGLL